MQQVLSFYRPSSLRVLAAQLQLPAVLVLLRRVLTPWQPRRSREEILGVGVAAPPTTMVVAG